MARLTKVHECREWAQDWASYRNPRMSYKVLIRGKRTLESFLQMKRLPPSFNREEIRKCISIIDDALDSVNS